MREEIMRNLKIPTKEEERNAEDNARSHFGNNMESLRYETRKREKDMQHEKRKKEEQQIQMLSI